jgi:predicted transcriptional regulator YheO
MQDSRVSQLSPACAAIAALLAPHAEVVLHDADRDEVLAIWNPMSARKPGDPSFLGELDRMAPTPNGVYGPYEKTLPDGRRISSVSALIPDAEGRPAAVLCVNVDRTPLEQAAALLSAFAAPAGERPEPLFEHDWTERVNEMVGAFIRERQRPLERLTRQDRLDILAELHQIGIFGVRGAVPVVARAMRLSRSTLYSLLSELRSTS